MALRIRSLAAGPLATNTYLVADEESTDALIIDAPPDSLTGLRALSQGYRVRGIIVTHGHWDHIGDVAALAEATGAPVATHRITAERLANPPGTADGLPVDIPAATASELLDDGGDVWVGDHAFDVIFTPGHDPGHIVLYSDHHQVLLGGDVVFPGGHGTLDVPGADPEVLAKSLARLATLPPDTIVYPGHGRPTTIGQELGWLAPFVPKIT